MTPTTPGEDKYSKFSCPNPECSLFNQTGQGNITHRSWTGKYKHIERLRCAVCRREFSEREGTLMSYTILRSILGGNFAEIPQFLVFKRFFYQSRVKQQFGHFL